MEYIFLSHSIVPEQSLPSDNDIGSMTAKVSEICPVGTVMLGCAFLKLQMHIENKLLLLHLGFYLLN